MNFGLLESLNLLGALGFFIFGMKIMSEGIQKAAGNKLRQILSSMTRNRFLGVFTGFLITLLIQSSSATTVMVVSFANAGLLNLVESIGVIMGANIGTTVTAWLIAFFGFKLKISSFALPIIAVGFPLMFAKKNSLKSLAEVLIGFALLFLGLDALKSSVPDLNQNPEVLAFLATFTDYGILSTIFFVIVGTIVTIIIQSSSAAMALTLTLLYTNVISFEVAAAMVLGENIGTTITANLAAIVANVHAKRAARAHLIFNVVGVVWMILLFPYFIDLVQWLWVPFQNALTSIIPDIGSSQEELQLSLFHTVFNIINTLLMVGFVPLIARIVTKMIPSKGDLDEEFHLEYIGTGMMLTTEAAILEAKKEVAKFGKLTKKMIRFIPKLLVETDKKEFKHLLARIKKYEDITDRIESEVSNYLAKVSEGELNSSASERIRSMLSIINDLERVGDVCYQMSKAIERKTEKKIWFTPEQRQNLKEMFDKVDQASELMVKHLEDDYDLVQLQKANELEKEINKLRNKFRKEHLVNIETGEYNFASGIIYNDLFSSAERLGDHIINVSEAVAGEV
jgi:phosphate:Na+ symporter